MRVLIDATVFWGTGIVFFLAKFINLHNSNTQGFWVELCQQVETGKPIVTLVVPLLRFARSLHRDKHWSYSLPCPRHLEYADVLFTLKY